jgi:hypothetical protein
MSIKALTFDIETIPSQTLPDDCRPQFDESDVRLGNLKDRLKIEEKMSEARAAFEVNLDKRLSLDPDLCQICSFAAHDGTATTGLFARDETEEYLLLHKAWGHIGIAYKGHIPIVGFNSRSFDLPVMLRRAMLLDVSVDPRMIENLTNRYFDGHIDLMQSLAFRNPFSGKPEMHGLDYYLRRFGVGTKKTGWTGADVYPAFKEGKFEEILEYNKDDVRQTAALFERVAPWLPGLNRAKPGGIQTTDDNKKG